MPYLIALYWRFYALSWNWTNRFILFTLLIRGYIRNIAFLFGIRRVDFTGQLFNGFLLLDVCFTFFSFILLIRWLAFLLFSFAIISDLIFAMFDLFFFVWNLNSLSSRFCYLEWLLLAFFGIRCLSLHLRLLFFLNWSWF